MLGGARHTLEQRRRQPQVRAHRHRRHLGHIEHGDVFEFLRTELGHDVAYALGKLTDVHRHVLVKQWQMMARGFETSQFQVQRSGLALLVAYLLHLIQNRHVQIPP